MTSLNMPRVFQRVPPFISPSSAARKAAPTILAVSASAFCSAVLAFLGLAAPLLLDEAVSVRYKGTDASPFALFLREGS